MHLRVEFFARSSVALPTEFGQGRLEVFCHALEWSTLKLAVFTSQFDGIHYGNERLAQVRYSGRASGTKIAFHARSEEHTSELQSRGHLVCRLLLEKKKTN